MKKLMTLMLGLTLALTTVGASFAQTSTAKKHANKKPGKKKISKHAAVPNK
jgi:hypothetical protein